MKLYLFLVLAFLFTTHTGIAQHDNANLLLQSPDGKIVKLVWFLKSGNPAITGFDIKRKEGLGQWEQLNTEPILPGIAIKKKLAIVESDNAELGRIKDKLNDGLKKGKLREIDNATYLSRLNNNDTEILALSAMMAVDYDIALMAGFGFVDHSLLKKTDYEYGLFIQGTNVLLDKVTWNYGEIPDLNVVREITSSSAPGKNGIKLMWTADLAKMKAGYVIGFNIYRQGMRLNDHPIQSVGVKELSEFSWVDKSAGAGSANQYSISAVSLFGIEGIIRPYTYDPKDHPSVYKKAEVTDVSSIGYYFKEGINVQWSFPKEYEHFVKGFYVEKDNMPEGYVQVSKLLDAGDRTFIDNTSSPVHGYIRFRIVALYNDKTTVPGAELLYHYFPMREPPRPINTRLLGTMENKKFTMKLSWDTKMNGDSLTSSYVVYLYDAVAGKFSPVTDKQLLKNNTYTYVVEHGAAATYRYYVTGMSRTDAESQPGDTVTMFVPSFDIPAPVIVKAIADGNKALLQWQYPDIQDIRGFRLYRNQVLIADEKTLVKGAKDFNTCELEPNVSNEFTLVAVTEKDLLSPVSAPMSLTIIPAVKKVTDYR